MKLLTTLAVLVLACVPASAGSFTFSIQPSGGTVTAAAGETAGWGYSITNNDSLHWLEMTNFSSGLFTNGTPLLLFDFPILAPNQTLTQLWTIGSTGLFEFTWDAGVQSNASNAGTFILTGQFWDGDPLLPGSTPQGGPVDQSQSYNVLVSGAQPVPEPATLSLAILGLISVAGNIRRRRGRTIRARGPE